MRASNARQVTATTCPLVDIQRSFCSRSASGYFGGNLPQKVKLVNGLALDLPTAMIALPWRYAWPGAAPPRAFFRARPAILRPTQPLYWATLSPFLGRFDVPPRPLLLRPSAIAACGGACRRKAAKIAIAHKNGQGTGVHAGFATGTAELQCSRLRGASPLAPILQTACEFRENGRCT